MNPVLTISDQPEPEADRIIGDGLNAFNEESAGYSDHKPLHVLVRDPDSGRVLGGIACLPPGTSRVFLTKRFVT
jgi:hypothetical protein